MKLLKKITAGTMMLVAISASAQEADNTRSMSPSFGVKGGVNFATINGDGFDSPDSRTSFHVGALAEFPLADIFSLQVEALYSGQGFEYDVPSIPFVTEGGKVEYQLDYINVPVLAKVYLFKGFSLEAGPQFSFLVNEEIDSAPNDNEGDTNTDAAKDFEFGFAGGVTFQTEMGLFATARYTQGVTEIFEDREDADNKATNSVFQIGIGYKF